MSVRRFDSGTIESVERTPQGGLRIPSRPTRVGVLYYRNPDGSERAELRPPEEVFDPVSLATLRGAPVTDLHPTEGPVTPENWRRLAIGHVADDVQPDGSHVSAPLLIQDAEEIKLIEAQERKELSCGYTCDLDETPGVWDGVHYDVVQRKIRYNHVALGPKGWGRAGPTASLRLDSRDAVEVNKTVSTEGRPMKVKIDGIEYEAGSEAHLQAVEKRHNDTLVELSKARAEKDSALGRADAAEKSAKDAKDSLARATEPKAIHALAKARADMLDKCRRVAKVTGQRFDDAEAESMDEGGMLLAMLKMLDPSFDPKGKSPDFVAGYAMSRLKSLLEGEGDEAPMSDAAPPAGGKAEEQVSGGVVPPAAPGRSDSLFSARGKASRETGTGPAVLRGDGSQDSPEAAEIRMRNDSQNAWQSTDGWAMSKA